jgi:hypothetical protein
MRLEIPMRSADPKGSGDCSDQAGMSSDVEFGCGRLNANRALDALDFPQQLFHLEVDLTDGPHDSWSSPSYLLEFMVSPWPGVCAGTFVVQRVTHRKYVQFPVVFATPPAVWGRGWSTKGFNAENPNWGMGWCEVEPGSITTSGCSLLTYAYRLLSGGWPLSCGVPLTYPSNQFVHYSASVGRREWHVRRGRRGHIQYGPPPFPVESDASWIEGTSATGA